MNSVHFSRLPCILVILSTIQLCDDAIGLPDEGLLGLDSSRGGGMGVEGGETN